ncbi:MAG: GC-type dockerin domain-anchored protein [Phycisphaerales bacterium JB039]
MRSALSILAGLSAALQAASGQVPGGAPRSDLWAPNAAPRVVAIDGRTMYLGGGGFTQFGYPTGAFALFDAKTARPLRPLVGLDGEIRVLVDDGAGGWFVAGDLILPSGTPTRIVHIASDGSIREVPVTLDGASPHIFDLERFGDALIVAGRFSFINGFVRNNLAAIDPTTGEVLPWHPAPDGLVIDLAPEGDRLYVAGDFNTIGSAGAPRPGAARFDGPDLTLSAWQPVADGHITAIEVAGGTAYLGGTFALPGGATGLQVAAVDAESGLATGWKVPVTFASGARVTDLLVHGDSVFVAGKFPGIGGETRTHIAAIDAVSAAILPFDISIPDSNPEVQSLAMTDQGLVIAGVFKQINLDPRRDVAMVDPVTGDTLPWDPMLSREAPTGSEDTRVQVAAGGAVAVGGGFIIAGGEKRNRFAALDLDTGELLDWTVAAVGRQGDPEFYVTGLIPAGGRIYISGTFEKVDGAVVNGLAAVSPMSGALDLTFQHGIGSLGVSRIRRTRDHLIAAFDRTLYGLDQATGSPVWSIAGVSTPFEADPERDYLYLLGRYEQVTPPAVRAQLAQLEAATGKLTAWDPGPDDDVAALAFWQDKLLIGGAFNAIGGELRPRLAVFEGPDPTARTLAPASLWEFAFGAGDIVESIAVGPELTLLGGRLSEIRGHPVDDIAALRLPEIRPLDWRPEHLGFQVVTAQEIVFAEQFRHFGGVYTPNLAVLPIEGACRVDLDGSGSLDLFDFLAFQTLFALGDLKADFTGDGGLDFFDFLAFQNEFAAGCS